MVWSSIKQAIKDVFTDLTSWECPHLELYGIIVARCLGYNLKVEGGLIAKFTLTADYYINETPPLKTIDLGRN